MPPAVSWMSPGPSLSISSMPPACFLGGELLKSFVLEILTVFVFGTSYLPCLAPSVVSIGYCAWGPPWHLDLCLRMSALGADMYIC